MNGDVKHVRIAGADISYQLSGNTEGHPLLLMHGGLGSSSDFKTILNFIPSEYFVISVDFRGHGRSTLGSKPLTYAQYVKDINAVLSKLHIEHYSILGFSDGGTVGYHLASKPQSRVQQLIAIGAPWRLQDDELSNEIIKSISPAFWEQKFPENLEAYRSLNPKPDFEKLFEKVKQLWLDGTKTGYPDRSVQDIQCPTLLIRGEADVMFPKNEADQLYHRLRNATLQEISGAEHAVHLEAPEIVGPMIRHFLNKNLIDKLNQIPKSNRNSLTGSFTSLFNRLVR